MKWVIFVIVVYLPVEVYAACTGSSPTWATTVDQASVSSCVSGASSGDTINIGSGTATWTSAVSIPSGKTLVLSGAGVGSTIISGASIDVFDVASDSTRITGIEFSCARTILRQVVDVRYDHNKFSCGTKLDAFSIVGSGAGPASPRALVDHNEFINGRVLSTPHAKTSVAELQNSSHWTRGAEWGTGEGLYIEDNILTITTSGNTVDCNYSARYVMRFNTVVDSYPEVHSVQATHRACRGGEIYNNTFESIAGGAIPTFNMYIRGGSWTIFRNVFTGSFGTNGLRLNNVRSCVSAGVDPTRADGNSGWDENTSPIGTYRGYLARDQIGAGADVAAWGAASSTPPAQGKAPMYAWLNTQDGANLAPTIGAGQACDGGLDYNTTHIVENRDYYTYQAVFDGTVGVGAGALSARPATCTTGVGYWATDQGTWNKIPGGEQGVLYKCTATNTWTLHYTPYEYPHPLQGYVPSTQRFAPSHNLRRVSWEEE